MSYLYADNLNRVGKFSAPDHLITEVAEAAAEAYDRAGIPTGEIQVNPLWENHYRVNIMDGKDIAFSHFCQMTPDGPITTPSFPEEVFQSERAAAA